MRLIVKQIKKELYSAVFEIWQDGMRIVGNISMQGALGSREGSFQINYNNVLIQMSPTGRREAKELAGSLIKRSPFRPYAIRQENLKGIMFHDQIKTGFLQNAGYHLLSFNGNVYFLYYVGFGDRGICAPVYRDDSCIGEIKKDCVVTDGLHIFDIILHEPHETGMVSALLVLCCYMYVVTYYCAGEKVLHGIQKNIVITKNNYLLSKCKMPL